MSSRSILIKGNPKYWINRVSEKFYSQLNNIFNFTETYESNIISSEIPPTNHGDTIVMFSRGCGYTHRFKKMGYRGRFIIIGCSKRDGGYGVNTINNPDDKTMNGNMNMAILIRC